MKFAMSMVGFSARWSPEIGAETDVDLAGFIGSIDGADSARRLADEAITNY